MRTRRRATARPLRDSAAPRGARRLLRGLYAGGTFAYEADLLLAPAIGPITEDADPPTADARRGSRTRT